MLAVLWAQTGNILLVTNNRAAAGTSAMKHCQVERAERASIPGKVSLEISPKLEQKTSPALFKKTENTFI